MLWQKRTKATLQTFKRDRATPSPHLYSSEADAEFKEIHAQSDSENEHGNTDEVCEREDCEVGSHGDTPLSEDDGEEDDKHEDLKDGVVVAGYERSDPVGTHLE